MVASGEVLGSHVTHVFKEHEGSWCGWIRVNKEALTGDEDREVAKSRCCMVLQTSRNLSSSSEQDGKPLDGFELRSVHVPLIF